MIVYISGMISNNPDYMKEFDEAEKLMLKRGYEVINPAKLNTIMPKSSTWNNYMDVCEILLRQANAIALLPNWENSRGAKIEVYLAKKLGRKIIKLGEAE